MERYKTFGTCAQSIEFEVENHTIKSVKFIGGCRGNTTGISKLVVGMDIDDVINRLSGTECRGGTSCPDQLAKALQEYKNKNNM